MKSKLVLQMEVLKKLVQINFQDRNVKDNTECQKCMNMVCSNQNENDFGCVMCMQRCLAAIPRVSKDSKSKLEGLQEEESKLEGLQDEESEGFTVSGTVVKTDSNHEFPSRLGIHWFNFMEGDDVRDGTAWQWRGGEDFINETNFQVQVWFCSKC